MRDARVLPAELSLSAVIYGLLHRFVLVFEAVEEVLSVSTNFDAAYYRILLYLWVKSVFEFILKQSFSIIKCP